MNYLDDIFVQYAEAFLGNMQGEGDIPHRERLRTGTLDYSVESLKSINQYLKTLHQRKVDDSSIEFQNVAVWCGAYIGEVIRKHANFKYHWVQYEDFMKEKDSNLRNLIPYTLGTHALLMAVDTSYMTMPINKVVRFMEEGEENDILFYAKGDINRVHSNKTPVPPPGANDHLQSKPWWKFW